MSLRRWKFPIVSAGLAFGILLTTSSLPLWSQAATGTLQGQVMDQQNAAIPGAAVKLTDTATNATLTTQSNDTGRYIFVNLPPGSYDLTINKPGFSTFKAAAQNVQVGQLLTINARLEVGTTATTVEVAAVAGAELQTSNATVGTTLSGPQLIELPNIGRDASTFAIFQPGVTPEGAVAGAMYDQNTFQLDGGNNSNDMDGSMRDYTGSYGHNSFGGYSAPPSGVLPTPPDTVEEFKVNTAGQTADFNGSSGAQIQMVTKRGTNDFHGTAYWYYHSSDVGGANTWDNNHTPSGNLGYTPIPIAHDNRYGLTIGGPMLPKFLGGKTYFFFGWEGFNYPQSAIITRQVPTDTLKAGVIQINEGGIWTPFNLNPGPVTVNGVTYQPAQCGGGPCDPRGIGLNPVGAWAPAG